MNSDLEFDSPHVKAELHSHFNFYRQLVQWWRIRKFFLPPNTDGSPAGNWHLPAAGGHWATAALSSLAGRKDNSVLLLCHCKVKLQSSAALFVLPERYESKSIYSREMKTHNYEEQTMAAVSDGLCTKELLSEWNHSDQQSVSLRKNLNIFTGKLFLQASVSAVYYHRSIMVQLSNKLYVIIQNSLTTRSI